jgi:peptide/nickel transport system substrate-binding protein
MYGPITSALIQDHLGETSECAKVANLAIDRDAIVKLMNGLAIPAKGQLDPTNPWFGTPNFPIKYDLPKAKALMSQAGYSKDRPLKAKVIIAQGGTGQMLSLPMKMNLCNKA